MRRVVSFRLRDNTPTADNVYDIRLLPLIYGEILKSAPASSVECQSARKSIREEHVPARVRGCNFKFRDVLLGYGTAPAVVADLVGAVTYPAYQSAYQWPACVLDGCSCAVSGQSKYVVLPSDCGLDPDMVNAALLRCPGLYFWTGSPAISKVHSSRRPVEGRAFTPGILGHV